MKFLIGGYFTTSKKRYYFDKILDLRCWLEIKQVGSSIHGKLLKPNDIDIAVSYKLPFQVKEKFSHFKIGKFNFLLIRAKTIENYVNKFDMGIVRGYKSLLTRKLTLFPEAKLDLKNKTITQYKRNDALFKDNYYGNGNSNGKHKRAERRKKYKAKLPNKRWKFKISRGYGI